jgi:ATP-binding cassette subfamily B protein
MIRTLRGAGWLLGMSWRQDRAKTAVALVLILGKSVCAPLLALNLKWLTNAAMSGDSATALIAAFAVSGCAVGMLTLGHFAHIAYFELSEINTLAEERRLIALANGTAGIEHQERAEYVDKVTLLEQEIQQIRNGFYAVLSLLGLVVGFGLTGLLLAMVNPLLLLLPLVAVPPLVAGQWAQTIADRSRAETTQDSRRAMHMFHLATGAGSAKELRVFRLEEEIERRHAEQWERATRRLWRAQVKSMALRAAGQSIFAIGYVAGILLVVNDAIGGHRSVGDVVLAITLAAQVNQQVAVAVSLLHDLQRVARAHAMFNELEKYVAEREPAPGDRQVPGRLTGGIDFENVTFRYPGTGRVVLQDVDLHLPAGSTVAIVGENGAGKSTLVKLLCRFYEPTSGAIRADGVDLARLPVDAWRQRISAGFQDFVRFEFTARRTVGIGNLPFIDDDAEVEAALDRAHARDVIDGLDDGLSTQLGKSHADGAELSGGQWQKLALGRAMMRELPLLLVLDEPTSALDAEAEHALYERYATGARRVGAATGGITILVSHRFSTVRMADLIVVVGDGTVLEVGSHPQLMRRGGLYAEMYEIQRGAYEDSGHPEHRPVTLGGRTIGFDLGGSNRANRLAHLGREPHR